jgi:hypothetical protein
MYSRRRRTRRYLEGKGETSATRSVPLQPANRHAHFQQNAHVHHIYPHFEWRTHVNPDSLRWCRRMASLVDIKITLISFVLVAVVLCT